MNILCIRMSSSWPVMITTFVFGKNKRDVDMLWNSRSNAKGVIFQTPGEVESMRHALVPFVQKNVVARSAFSSWVPNVLSSSPFFFPYTKRRKQHVYISPFEMQTFRTFRFSSCLFCDGKVWLGSGSALKRIRNNAPCDFADGNISRCSKTPF